MANPKLLTLWIVLALAVAGVRADAGIEEVIAEPVAPDSALKLEIEQLRSKISSLESSISDRSRELKNKDEGIAHLEKIVHEKSAAVASLQSEIDLLQKKGAVDAENLVGKAHARAGELENQVEKLKIDLEAQTRKRDALEARASEAEKKVGNLNSKLQNLEKLSDDQKRRLQKTERALHVAEEELMKVRMEATSKTKELTEVHGAWLPPWLATHVGCCQDFAATHWNEHGKPALDIFLQKASEKAAQAQKWMEPHLDTAKTKWIPAIKQQWVTVTTYVRPHVETVSAKSSEVYEVCRSTISPHVVKVQEFVGPYVQEARKFSKPYVDQIATVTKPHVEKVHSILKPYTNHVVYAYGKFLESATTYHHQVQAVVLEKLKQHELTEPLATKELVWFMASASLALPIFFLYKILSAVFCKKAVKPARDGHASQAHRRHKRRHVDK